MTHNCSCIAGIQHIPVHKSAKMTTSKGTIQGFNALTAADKKHQIVTDAQVFGSGPEQHTLKPIVEAIRERFERLDIPADFSSEGIIITADTGFASEGNMEYLHEDGLNAYVPDNHNAHGMKNSKAKKPNTSTLIK